MRFFKTFLGVILCILALGWGITALTEKRALWLIGTGMCLMLAALLFRKTKKDRERAAAISQEMPKLMHGELRHAATEDSDLVTVHTEYSPGKVPSDIAKEMRKSYTLMQARRDAEIMVDSYRLASNTLTLETFCMRYELTMQKAHTLLQAEQVGVRGIKKLNYHNACIAVISSAESLKVRVLHDYAMEKMYTADALKTNKGKLNRYIKMLMELEKAGSTFMFMDEYDALLEKVKDRIADLRGATQ